MYLVSLGDVETALGVASLSASLSALGAGVVLPRKLNLLRPESFDHIY